MDLPAALVEALQTGDRLSYHPERAQAEIRHFRDLMHSPLAQWAQ
jgi:hypothetical protein